MVTYIQRKEGCNRFNDKGPYQRYIFATSHGQQDGLQLGLSRLQGLTNSTLHSGLDSLLTEWQENHRALNIPAMKPPFVRISGFYPLSPIDRCASANLLDGMKRSAHWEAGKAQLSSVIKETNMLEFQGSFERRRKFVTTGVYLIFQACVSFLRCFRKGNLRKSWQFLISFYRRLSPFLRCFRQEWRLSVFALFA